MSLCKRVAHIRSRTVLIVRQALYDDGGSARTVAFISTEFVIAVSSSLLDTALDRIVRHIVGSCLGDDLCQLEVVGRVRTALFYCNSNLSSDNGKNLSLCRIIFFFLVLNVGKF